ncbi:hypothetical protein, partial [Frischella japonica]|uniref:hypothetical protein n=1 Tax=Frischella japonica TaxID=2741544 RepID=UPI001CA73D4B
LSKSINRKCSLSLMGIQALCLILEIKFYIVGYMSQGSKPNPDHCSPLTVGAGTDKLLCRKTCDH